MSFFSVQLENSIKRQYPIETGLNNPILRNKSKPIKKIDKNVIKFCNDLKKATLIYDGIWLAAPQIWKNLQIICVWQLDASEKKILFFETMINPKIIKHSDSMNVDIEWCLSLPGIEAKVKRYDYVKVKYLSCDNRTKIIEAWNYNARILQHEIDHLNWILFLDRKINL